MTRGKSGLFPGWYVVGGAFGVTFVGFGTAYTFSAFLPALEAAFHASRGSLSIVFGLAGFLYFALGSISGPLADRFGARPLALVGMTLLSIGFLLASVARTLTELLLAYGLGVGLGVGLSYVPAVAAVQRWFVERRATASGLAVAGIGAGTLVLPPLAAGFVDWFGWRQAYLVIGIGSGLFGLAAALLLHSDPARRGYRPYGEVAGAPVRTPSVGLKQAVRSRLFIRLYLGCLASAFAVFVPFVHLAPSALDQGIEADAAASLIALIGIGSMVGRFFLGGVADRVGRLRFLSITYLGMAGSMGLWLAGSGFLVLALFAVIFGLFYGAWVAVLPSVVMDGFGGAHVSSIIGVLYSSVAFGTLAGPAIAGYGFDVSGSYAIPIALGLAANLLAMIITITTAPTSLAELA